MLITGSVYRKLKDLENKMESLNEALDAQREANRRWEESATLVEALRVENASLRAQLEEARRAAQRRENQERAKASKED